jgi:hypothetical protein
MPNNRFIRTAEVPKRCANGVIEAALVKVFVWVEKLSARYRLYCGLQGEYLIHFF